MNGISSYHNTSVAAVASSSNMTVVVFSFFILLLVSIAQAQASNAENDLITDLPGLNFKPTFKQYSGYLDATDGKNLFYWLVESQNNPSVDPVLLWLNGGPGCSSLGGFLTELGPFHVNPDGHTLYENVFAWNKFANVLFLESPTGVGFSYSSPKNDTTNDDLTAYHNFQALRDFFYNKFPEYKNRDFYVSGESYGGVYVPTLAKEIIDGVKAGTFPDIFRGIAVGNGYMSHMHLFNSLLNLYYYHGIKGADEWNSLLQACCPNNRSDECNFYGARGGTQCSSEIGKFRSAGVNDVYNMYQDCYSTSKDDPGRQSSNDFMEPPFFKLKPLRPNFNNLPPGTKDMSHQLNYDSTDSEFGFQCWGNAVTYFNNVDVKKALHVADQVLQKHWCDCCAIPYRQQTKYFDMSETFSYIIKNSKIRILIYNGDVDLSCNFLGDQWLVERQIAPDNQLKVLKQRSSFTYRRQIAGFVKQFERLDLLTVKGAGHFVPTDRAGPALQMIFNFIKNIGDYSKATGIDVTPKPITS